MLSKCERQLDSSVRALSEHSRKLRLVEKGKEEFYSEDRILGKFQTLTSQLVGILEFLSVGCYKRILCSEQLLLF